MHFKKKTVLIKGGFVSMKKNSFGIVDKDPIVKSNMIVGKLMKPIVESTKSDNSLKIVGGDIMDFNKGVKSNVKRLQKRKEDENIKFIY